MTADAFVFAFFPRGILFFLRIGRLFLSANFAPALAMWQSGDFDPSAKRRRLSATPIFEVCAVGDFDYLETLRCGIRRWCMGVGGCAIYGALLANDCASLGVVGDGWCANLWKSRVRDFSRLRSSAGGGAWGAASLA